MDQRAAMCDAHRSPQEAPAASEPDAGVAAAEPRDYPAWSPDGQSIAFVHYSASRIGAQLTIDGRGFYFSRTPDGAWRRFRLRRRRCA
jgi:hypothetical protein